MIKIEVKESNYSHSFDDHVICIQIKMEMVDQMGPFVWGHYKFQELSGIKLRYLGLLGICRCINQDNFFILRQSFSA